MRLAERLGVAPSVLEGRVPKTHLRPDGEGGFFVEREPEFTQTDIALLYAASEVERTTTDRGFNISDEISPLADPSNPDATHYFHAEPDGYLLNHAVRAKENAEKKWRETNKGADTSGLFWTVEKVPIKR